MAEIRTADIVLSLTGRDRGQLMLVVAEEGDFLLLANGRARRADATSAHGLSCKAKAG